MGMDAQQKRELAALALLTAWLEDEDGTCELPATLVSDIVVELGGGDDLPGVLEGALSLVAGLRPWGVICWCVPLEATARPRSGRCETVSLLFA